MSDTEQPTSAAKDTMPASDVEFLLTCIKNTTGGSLSVDASKVASALGYTNVRSVSNKVSAMKKKYGLAISATASKADNSATAGPANPKTPTPAKAAKGKVTKPKTPRKTPVKKKFIKAESESAEDDDDDEKIEDFKELSESPDFKIIKQEP